MITKDPMGIKRPPIRPGHLPEPFGPEPVRAHDPPEFVAECLSCPLPECRQESAACPLHGKTRPGNPRRRGWRAKP